MRAWEFTVHGGEKIANRRKKTKCMETPAVKTHWRNSFVLMGEPHQEETKQEKIRGQTKSRKSLWLSPGPTCLCLVTNIQCLGTFKPLDILVLSRQILARP